MIINIFITHLFSSIDNTINPVLKIPIVVYGNEGEVYIDEMASAIENINISGSPAATQQQQQQQEEPQAQQEPQEVGQQPQQPQQQQQEGGFANGGGGPSNGQYFIQRLDILQGGILAVRNGLTEIRRDQEVDRTRVNRQHNMLLSNMQRLAIRPAVAIQQQQGNNSGNSNNNNNTNQTANIGEVEIVNAATLSPTPKSLYILWHEWMHGIGGRKAARFFTASERGKEKYKFCRRKVLWDLVGEMVRSGLEANVAIDRIYHVYGANRTITYILNQLKVDKRNNTLHPTLRM